MTALGISSNDRVTSPGARLSLLPPTTRKPTTRTYLLAQVTDCTAKPPMLQTRYCRRRRLRGVVRHEGPLPHRHRARPGAALGCGHGDVQVRVGRVPPCRWHQGRRAGCQWPQPLLHRSCAGARGRPLMYQLLLSSTCTPQRGSGAARCVGAAWVPRWLCLSSCNSSSLPLSVVRVYR